MMHSRPLSLTQDAGAEGQMPVGNAHAQYELAIPMESVGDCFTKVQCACLLYSPYQFTKAWPFLPMADKLHVCLMLV